jgi:hypothetical protein
MREGELAGDPPVLSDTTATLISSRAGERSEASSIVNTLARPLPRAPALGRTADAKLYRLARDERGEWIEADGDNT